MKYAMLNGNIQQFDKHQVKYVKNLLFMMLFWHADKFETFFFGSFVYAMAHTHSFHISPMHAFQASTLNAKFLNKSTYRKNLSKWTLWASNREIERERERRCNVDINIYFEWIMLRIQAESKYTPNRVEKYVNVAFENNE